MDTLTNNGLTFSSVVKQEDKKRSKIFVSADRLRLSLKGTANVFIVKYCCSKVTCLNKVSDNL